MAHTTIADPATLLQHQAAETSSDDGHITKETRALALTQQEPGAYSCAERVLVDVTVVHGVPYRYSRCK